MPQIETERALENLEEIVCTEGIDAAFVGPMDLSMSLGVFRQFDSPSFLRAIEKFVSTCDAHGVAPGLLAPAGPVERSIQQGFKLIAIGGDLAILAGGVADLLKKAREATDESARRI